MITTDELLKIFSEKLLKTGSFDDAFKKSHWIAYKEGVKDGQESPVGADQTGIPPSHIPSP